MSAKSYWIGGKHAIAGVVASAPERILSVVVTRELEATSEPLIEQLLELGLSPRSANKQEVSGLIGNEQHQGIALQVRAKAELDEHDLSSHLAKHSDKQNWFICVLDQVQDPHNLGACLRTAYAAGVDCVVVPKDRSAPMSAVVHKVASGAAELIDVYRVTNLARALKYMQEQGIWLVGTSDQAQHSLYESKLQGSIAILMGAEGKGLRRLTMDLADELVSIPMANEHVSSLNVSVATGVCLYEVVRQRRI